MRTKVKICGIRSFEDAKHAIDAGADFLGFNFVSNSKRYIEHQKAEKIINKLTMDNVQLTVKFVGVFQNHPVNEVNEITDFLGLDFVQLHGEEDGEYMKEIKANIIKKLVISTVVKGFFLTELKEQVSGKRFRTSGNDNIKYFLLDRAMQGQGEMVNLEYAKEIAKQFPIFFAGGLTPDNVASVVASVAPFAVDVAGGIETDGKIDYEKMNFFINEVKMIAYKKDSGQAGMTFYEKGVSVKKSFDSLNSLRMTSSIRKENQ